jgi:hypothetical protein
MQNEYIKTHFVTNLGCISRNAYSDEEKRKQGVLECNNNTFHSKRFNQAVLFKAYFYRVSLRENSPQVASASVAKMND